MKSLSNKKYNLLLPIAGKAQRFLDAGFTFPKPLIMASGKHIVDWSMESIDYSECNLIFVVRQDHINSFSIDTILKEKFGTSVAIVTTDGVTDGAVSTCLLAKNHIDNDLPLIIYTPDVYFQDSFNPACVTESLDGFILTFKANSPAHSYVELNSSDLAVRTAEKEVISENAAVGVYYFKSGRSFVKYASEMVSKNIRTKGEFYICPVYNLMIADGMSVGIENVKKMHVLGTPDDLYFFNKCVSPKFGDKPVGLCADHSGFDLKNKFKKALVEAGIDCIDFGTYVAKDCDYNHHTKAAISAMQLGQIDFTLGFCRTGQGINIFANHSTGIRSALILDSYMAEYAVRHNCPNFFSFAQKYVKDSDIAGIIKALKESTFDGGRHMSRMKEVVEKLT